MIKERFDLDAIRRMFPITQRILYLDSARHTPLALPVRRALDRFYTESEQYAGPKSVWLERVEAVREKMARMIGAQPSEIAFTKNTSDGLNLTASAIPFRSGDNVLLNFADHPNITSVFFYLSRKGVDVLKVQQLDTAIDFNDLMRSINPKTRAIALSHVTFDRGYRYDIDSIGRLCQVHDLYFVLDAMQSVGVMPLDVVAAGASMVAFGCNKGLLSPPGLGILYCRAGQHELQPAYAPASNSNPGSLPLDIVAVSDAVAFRDDAKLFESGIGNLPAVHALGAALDLINGIGVDNIAAHVLDLGEYLTWHMEILGIRIVGPRTRLEQSHIYVLDLPGDNWLKYLAANNVRVSLERDGIRVSFAMFNTSEDVDRLVELIRGRLSDIER